MRLVRTARKMTQTEVAGLTGMANTYVSDLENGRKGVPPGESVTKLADALQTSADYLLGRTDEMDPPSLPNKQTQTLDERLVEIERKFREARFSEHDVNALMQIARSIAQSLKSDESPDI